MKDKKFFLDFFFRGGSKITIDNSDLNLANKIRRFQNNCQKMELNSYSKGEEYTYGVNFNPEWDEDRGFTFDLQASDKPSIWEKHNTVEEQIAACKMQIKFLKKARHSLAVLIRLKERLGLPGPIQEIRIDSSRPMGSLYVPLTQEEIDDFLKY